MLRTTRVGAYGLLHDDDGRVLLQHLTSDCTFPDSWRLPGGGVEHGEDPADAVVRAFAEETGLDVEVADAQSTHSAVTTWSPNWIEHGVGICYQVKVVGGALRSRIDHDLGDNRWRLPAEVAGLRMSISTAEALGVARAELQRSDTHPLPEPAVPPPGCEQRVGVYAWLTDPAGRVLLTLVPEGYWAAGMWHLPGGGLDFGEAPASCLLREIYEETGQQAALGGLRQVGSRRNRKAQDDHSGAGDFHGIHIVYDAVVDDPTPLHILDEGGSTVEVRWFDPDEIAALPQTPAVADALAAKR